MLDEDIVEKARVDERPRRRRLLAPLVTLGVSALALGYVAAVDPNTPGHYPLCPTKYFFGFDCPGCGLTRATHDLITGNVAGALDHNIFIIILAPLAVVLWVRWFLRSWRGESPEVTYGQFRRRNMWMMVGLVALLAFGVIRNFVPYLGSGLS